MDALRPFRRGTGVVADADTADSGQAREVAALDFIIELACRAHELLQILEPALRLDRPFGLELGEVAAARERDFETRPDACLRSLRDLVHELEKVAQAAQRLAGDTGDRGILYRLAKRDPGALRVGVDLPD